MFTTSDYVNFIIQSSFPIRKFRRIKNELIDNELMIAHLQEILFINSKYVHLSKKNLVQERSPYMGVFMRGLSLRYWRLVGQPRL